MLGAGDSIKFIFKQLYKQLKLLKMKKNDFAGFFNPMKSMPINGSGINKSKKRFGRLVWDSSIKGTYVRAIHGELK